MVSKSKYLLHTFSEDKGGDKKPEFFSTRSLSNTRTYLHTCAIATRQLQPFLPSSPAHPSEVIRGPGLRNVPELRVFRASKHILRMSIRLADAGTQPLAELAGLDLS